MSVPRSQSFCFTFGELAAGVRRLHMRFFHQPKQRMGLHGLGQGVGYLGCRVRPSEPVSAGAVRLPSSSFAFPQLLPHRHELYHEPLVRDLVDLLAVQVITEASAVRDPQMSHLLLGLLEPSLEVRKLAPQLTDDCPQSVTVLHSRLHGVRFRRQSASDRIYQLAFTSAADTYFLPLAQGPFER